MKLGIKHTILLVVSLLIAVSVLVGGLGIYSTNRAVDLLEGATLRDIGRQTQLVTLMLRMETNRSQILQALQHSPGTEFAKKHDHPVTNHFVAVAKNSELLTRSWEEFQSSVRSSDEAALASKWYELSHGLGLQSVTAAAAAIKTDQWDVAEHILITDINPAYKAADPAFQELNEFLGKRSHASAEQAHSSISQQNYTMLASIFCGALLSVAAGLLLLKSINAPLHQAVSVARRIALGDLTGTVSVTSHNEFGLLQAALRDMTASLVRIVGEVRAGTDTMAIVSHQIASGNMDLSARTEQQASALEETASSMEELNATVRQNFEHAQEANLMAVSAARVAERGGIVVSQVVSTMGSINESARKIADIIGVIDGIAFQTNILALNAAVEAARAGEQGRGFAVVASEVRNLAQRSATAAKEIKILIVDSVAKVDSGSLLVDQAGATMDEILTSIQKVTGIMADITIASDEQRAGIEQVNVAISEMDTTTQQNAALVDRAAEAAQSLEMQANSLTQLVSVFEIDTSPSTSEAALAMVGRSQQHSSAAQVLRLNRRQDAAKPVALPSKRAY